MQLYLCEKPSQGKDIGAMLGATQHKQGYLAGAGIIVTWAIGHLLEQAQPETYGEQYGAPWRESVLPILPAEWKMTVKKETADQFAVIRSLLKQVDSVVIATDADREGEVIARELLEYCHFTGPDQRLWLSALDEASIRHGLANKLPGEIGYPSSEFTRSLLLFEPSVTVTRWIMAAYQWAFVDSGFLNWIQRTYNSQVHSHNAVARELSSWSGQLATSLKDYLLATLYVLLIAVVWVTILVLSIPLFVLVILVALTESLGRRDIRRYGAGDESSFVYHHAKRMVKPAIYIPACSICHGQRQCIPTCYCCPPLFCWGSR